MGSVILKEGADVVQRLLAQTDGGLTGEARGLADAVDMGIRQQALGVLAEGGGHVAEELVAAAREPALQRFRLKARGDGRVEEDLPVAELGKLLVLHENDVFRQAGENRVAVREELRKLHPAVAVRLLEGGLSRAAEVAHVRAEVLQPGGDHRTRRAHADDARLQAGDLHRIGAPLLRAEAVQIANQLADDVFDDALVAVVLHARHDDALFAGGGNVDVRTDGELEYRSLRFETEELEQENYQGNAVVNYTEYEIPYTRIIEHKHFEFACQGGNEGSIPKTIITKEYPATWKKGDEPYYPMNDEKNNKLYAQYKELAEKESNVIFGGRLGMYKYFDMHNVVEEALNCVKENMCAKN